MIKCIYGTKIGDSILQDEDGTIICTYPDTFYEKGLTCYWMLKLIGYRWEILRVLVVLKEE